VADPDPPQLPTTSYAVLGLLSFGGEFSGYDLKKWADFSLRFFFWSPATSNIYGELKRLRSLGYVTAREAPQDDLRNKRMFSITPAGQAALEQWLDEAPVEPPVLKEHGLLRVWLGHATDRDRLIEVVTEQEDIARRTLDELRDSLSKARKNERYSNAVLVEEWCERVTEARADAYADLRAKLAKSRNSTRART
jgi:DNA-binding PadR family transcriptional regulator